MSRTLITFLIFSLTLSPLSALASETVAPSQDCTDHLGSVRFLTDSSGNVIRSYTYTPYGTATTTTSSASTTPYQYTNENFDSETGLTYLRARYYDPTVGRFISRDPVRGTLDNPITQDPYIYGASNPTTYTDPSGEIVWDVIDVGFFVLSLNEFNDCPGFWNGLQLGADTLSLLPGIPSLGWVLRADDIGKFLKAGGKEFTISNHAGQRMLERGIDATTVQNTIKKRRGVPVFPRGGLENRILRSSQQSISGYRRWESYNCNR